MATLLTTSKMNPALAARIEASVRGRRGQAGSTQRARRVVSLARLVLVLTVAYGIYNVVMGRRQSRRELAQTRTALLDAVRAHGASLTVDDQLAVTRAETWVARFSGAYEGDLVDDELRAPGALAAMLARPTVYVRGQIDAVTSSSQIAIAAAASVKDPLLLCLLEPPASRGEAMLLEKVRAAYTGGSTLESRTANVHRLHEAVVGLPFLLPQWSEKVRAAEDRPELLRLRAELDRAPIERAKQAAKAGLLLVAIDEPGDGKGPTELDGERPHTVRVGAVDVAARKILLRVRHRVDPSWISPARRPTYASGLDGCALAFDIHESVRGAHSR